MKIERQFDYHPPTGMLKLLGLLCLILGPITLFPSFRDEFDEISIGLFTFSGWLAPYAFGAIGLAIILAGIAMIKGSLDQDRIGGQIVFTDRGVIVSGLKTDKLNGTMHYDRISDISVSQKRGNSVLTFKQQEGLIAISSKCMKSEAEFAEVCRLLDEHIVQSAEMHKITDPANSQI